MDVNGLKEYHDTPDTERAYRDMRNFAATDVGGIECVGAALSLASSDSIASAGEGDGVGGAFFGVEGDGVVGGGFDFDGMAFVVGYGGVGYVFVGYFYFVAREGADCAGVKLSVAPLLVYFKVAACLETAHRAFCPA